MNIRKIASPVEIYSNPAIADLLAMCLVAPTLGKIQDVAQSIYGKSQGQFYILEIDEIPVGIIGGSEIDKGHFVLRHVAVVPEHRRKGYGKRLFKHAVAQRDYSSIEAEVGDEAVDFLRGNGFTCKIIKDHPLDLKRYNCNWSN